MSNCFFQLAQLCAADPSMPVIVACIKKISIQLGFPHLISRQSITYRGLQLLGHHFFLGVAEWAVLLGGCSQWSTAFAFLRALQCHIGNKMTEGKRLSKTLQPYKKNSQVLPALCISRENTPFFCKVLWKAFKGQCPHYLCWEALNPRCCRTQDPFSQLGASAPSKYQFSPLKWLEFCL